MNKSKLTINTLKKEAQKFATAQSKVSRKELFGVTDDKAIGTMIEHQFKKALQKKYKFEPGNSASGIDLPELDVDIKTTSIKQPQSSCPFKSARQKIYGLGYSLLVFVYQKTDSQKNKTGRLKFLHTIFVEKEKTADHQITKGIRDILENDGNKDDLLAFMEEKHLPVDEIEADKIADALLTKAPELGYLTISNALQWRLQYGRVIAKAGSINGIHCLHHDEKK